MWILEVVDKIFLIYTLLIFVRILGSWFPAFQESVVMRFAAFYVDPYLNLFRRVIPPLGMMDISPIVALFVLQIIQEMVKSLLIKLF